MLLSVTLSACILNEINQIAYYFLVKASNKLRLYETIWIAAQKQKLNLPSSKFDGHRISRTQGKSDVWIILGIRAKPPTLYWVLLLSTQIFQMDGCDAKLFCCGSI